MKHNITSIFLILLCPYLSYSQAPDQHESKISKLMPATLVESGQSGLQAKDKLVVLWTSGDRDVALKTVCMYAFNAKIWEWWNDITLIVWGPSVKLLSEDEELQAELKKMMEAGVVVKACKACADQYGVSEKLEELGVDVKYTGKEFTDYIKEGRHVLTI